MNINRTLMCILLAGCMASFNTACQRQDNVQAGHETVTAGGTADKDMLTSDEQQIAMKIEESHIGEMDLSRLAKERASNKDVKDYADMLLDDHEKALKDMNGILKDKRATDASAQQKPAEGKAELDKLQGMSGVAFDTEYMNAMVADHQKTLNDLQANAATVQNPDLKDYINDLTKTVSKHLEKGQDLQAKMAGDKR